jgi:hypothetical protein
MMDAADLQDFIFKAALAGCGADVKAHKAALWRACIAIMSDVLRESDPFTALRLVRSLEPRLRDAGAYLDQLLDPPPSPYPRVH